MTPLPIDYLDEIRRREVQKRLEESGWFAHGLVMINRLETAGFTRSELCWFIPERGLGADLLIGSELVGLPVHEVSRGGVPGVALVLPTCNRNANCPAHPQPPAEVAHLYDRWARRHLGTRS